MKRIVMLLALAFCAVSLKAQVDNPDFEKYKKQTESEFKQYSDSVWQAFSEYRQKANEEYAQFMREQWKAFAAMQEEQRPAIPEPPQPFERDEDTPIPEIPKPIPVKPLPIPKPSFPDPKLPDIPKPAPFHTVKEFNFVCYGTPCKVHFDNSLKINIGSASEAEAAKGWENLSNEMGELLLEDCLRLRKDLSLGDWAYYCLLRDLTDGYYGTDSNEAKLMQAYLLAQSGYDFRIGRQDGRLVLLLPFDGDIFYWENSPKYITRYITISGRKYYIISKSSNVRTYVSDQQFSNNDRVFSLRMTCPPKFSQKAAGTKSFASSRFPELNVKITPNRNLMDFYEEYPSCEWTNYAWAGLSDEVKGKLYPMLRAGIAGKGQIEAANRLINFVQTAFVYKTDGGQFGYERSLFGDETFFYPYSDCEDRAILFSILVRDLLGLDVVLLLYHDHMATAVSFTESLNGFYFTLNGKNYYVSDPTYMGADVGMCAPAYVNESPKVYKL